MGGSLCPFQQLDVLQLDPDRIMGRQRGNRPAAVEQAQLGSKLKTQQNQIDIK